MLFLKDPFLGFCCFFIFVNDIANVSKLLHLILFADDTNMFVSDSNFNTLIDTANNELILLTNWFQANCLTVNLNKSNFIVFCSPKLKYNRDLSIIKINKTVLHQVDAAKFLGVYIDEHLNWKKTCTNHCAKNLQN